MGTSKALVVNGFKEDCEKLISRFEQADDVRFQTFCEIWKDMKFSLILTGRQTILELLELCEEALHICKQFFLLPSRFKDRIGGLYLLYGVYYKMPIDQFKIRVKLEDWRSIAKLHAEIKEAEHLDANYILCKLITDHAFHYCLFDHEFGLEKHFRMKERQCFNPYSVLPVLKDLTSEQHVLPEIASLSKLYKEKKSALMAKMKSNSLNLYDTDIAETIVKDIQTFEEHRKDEQARRGAGCDKQFAASTSKEDSDKISQLKSARKKIKSKLAHGFDTDSSESDDEMIIFDDHDINLPELFD